MTVREDVQKLEPGPLIELWELDGTLIGGSIVRFQNHRTHKKITFQGIEYFPWPIEGKNFARTSGQQPTPSLSVGNVDGSISFLCMAFEDMVGAVLTRRQTFGQYLDAVNFQINMVVPSTDMTDPLWIPFNATIGGTTNGVNGNPTLFKLIPDAVVGAPNVYYDDLAAIADYTIISASMYFKAAEYDKVRLRVQDKDHITTAQITYDFATGQVTSASHSVGQSPTYGVDVLDNGIVRLKIGNFDIGTGVLNPRILGRVFDATGLDFAGDGVSGVYMGDAQIELNNVVTAYQPLLTIAEANPTADPDEELPPEIWFVERKAVESPEVVEFELASALNFEDKQLPGRQIKANHCDWTYRGEGCNYVGPPVATVLDAPTVDPLLDRCGKRLASCALREWPDDILNFSSYPAAGMIRT